MSGSIFSGSVIPPQPTGSDTSTQYPLWLQQFVSNLGSAATNLADTPYSAFPGPQIAAPSAATQQAQKMALGNVNNYGGALNQAFSNTSNAASPLTAGQIGSYVQPYNSTVQNSGGQFTGALNNAAGAGAAGYTGALNNAITSAIPGYMNPYTSNVVGGIESAMNTNLMQNVLPGIQDKFVSAGQSRSPQEAQLTDQAIYANQQAIGQAISPALQQGYQGALNAAQGAANTGLNAGLGTANTGFGLGSTGYTTGLGTAAQQQQMQQLTGAQFGQLGALTQQLGAVDTGQVAAAGQAQDTNNQANINAALNNFYAQQQWPYQNLAYASNIIRGQPVASNTQTVGLQYAPGQGYTASPLSAFIGTTLGGSALLNGNGNANGTNQVNNALSLKKGGPVRRSANDNRGPALTMYRRAA